MFGFDDATLERARAGRRPLRTLWRAAVALGLVVVAAVAAALGFAWWTLTTPEGMQRAVDWFTADQPVRVTLTDVEVLDGTRLLAPRTWRIAVTGIAYVPDDPTAVSFTIARLALGPPDPWRLWEQRDLHFDRLELAGLAIHVKRQRPPPPWTPTEPRLRAISADEVEVTDASYRADPDDPLGEGGMTGLHGTLRDVSWLVGTRELSGESDLAGETFRTGSLLLHDPRCHLRSERSTLTLTGGTFSFAGGTATFEGTVADFHKRAEVTMTVHLRDADVAEVVETTTGNPSRVLGVGSLDLTIHSGGDLPRGGAWMEGHAAVSQGRVQLGRNVKDVTRDLIRLAPFLDLNAQDQVVLDEMDGELRLDRGSVDIRELLYRAPEQTVQVRGRIDTSGMALLLRLVPRKDPTKPSIGLVLHEHDKQYHVRVATREELLGTAPIVPGHVTEAEAVEQHQLLPGLKGLGDKLRSIKLPKPFKKRAAGSRPESPR